MSKDEIFGGKAGHLEGPKYSMREHTAVQFVVEGLGVMSGDIITGYDLAKKLKPFIEESEQNRRMAKEYFEAMKRALNERNDLYDQVCKLKESNKEYMDICETLSKHNHELRESITEMDHHALGFVKWMSNQAEQGKSFEQLLARYKNELTLKEQLKQCEK